MTGGLSVVICLLPDLLAAQDTPKKEVPDGAAAHMSVVALGPIPQRRYKMPDDDDLEDIKSGEDGGAPVGSSGGGSDPATAGNQGKGARPARDPGAGDIPILLPPMAGAVPPSTLYYKLPKAPPNGNPWGRIRVGFNNATSVTKVHAGVPLDLHSIDRAKNSAYRSYLKLPPLEPWSQVVVFLTPSRKGKTPWKSEPTFSVLNLRSQALLDKNVLVRNFSNEPVAFIIDDNQPVTLNSGQRKSFVIAKKDGFHRVAAIQVQGKVPVLNTSLRFPTGTLTVMAFYNAEPQTNGGKTVGAFRTTLDKISPEELRKKMTDLKP